MKKQLWIRKLACGHERLTNLAFISGNYKKPKVDELCHCRVCFEDVKIVEVEEAREVDLKNIEKIKDEIKNGNK